MLAAIGAAAPYWIPAVASAFGQSQANRANLRIANAQMAFQDRSQQKAMDFEERMSGSSWQRAVADMRLAGINPMLAFAQGGASTPSIGGMPGSSATMQDVIGPAVSSAQSARRLERELRLIDQQDYLTAQQAGRIGFENALTLQSQLESSARTTEIEARTLGQQLQNKLLGLSIPAAQNQARVDNSIVGRAAAFIERITGALPRIGFSGSSYRGRIGRSNSINFN